MALDRDIRLLASVPFFQGIGPEAMKLLAFSAEPREHIDRDRVFSAGDPAEGGLLVLEGRVDLIDESARPPRMVERVGAGSLIGEMAMIVETRRVLSGFAVGPTRLLSIRRALFRRMLENYPEIAVLLKDRVADRLKGLSPQVGRIGEAFGAIDGHRAPGT